MVSFDLISLIIFLLNSIENLCKKCFLNKKCNLIFELFLLDLGSIFNLISGYRLRVTLRLFYGSWFGILRVGPIFSILVVIDTISLNS